MELDFRNPGFRTANGMLVARKKANTGLVQLKAKESPNFFHHHEPEQSKPQKLAQSIHFFWLVLLPKI